MSSTTKQSSLRREFVEIGTTFRDGDWKTRVSYLILGFGPILRGQLVKGIAYLACEVLFFVYLFRF